VYQNTSGGIDVSGKGAAGSKYDGGQDLTSFSWLVKPASGTSLGSGVPLNLTLPIIGSAPIKVVVPYYVTFDPNGGGWGHGSTLRVLYVY
jgi:hypothetical protein